MRKTISSFAVILCIAGASALFYSCPLPQQLVFQQTGQAAPQASVQRAPAVETDPVRNRAVYVSENGVRTDIESVEPDGTVVTCVDAEGIVVADSEVAADPMSRKASFAPASLVKAIVIGMRSDGNPGIWIILKNGTILPAENEFDGKKTSRLPESDDRDGILRGPFGWRYFITGISEDGGMVVGYAKNEKGFHNGKVTVDPGTTIGVYWKVTKKPKHPYVSVGRARVIGVLDPAKLPQWNGRWSRWIGWIVRNPRSQLQLFFAGYYDTYLVMADSVSFDPAKELYSVPGTDQDGQKAVATIDTQNRISITPVTVPTDLPDLTVTTIQVPSAAQSTTTQWTLGATVKNAGIGPAGASSIEYRLSPDATLDASDTLIGSHAVPALAAGESITDTWSTSYSIPAAGTYWIFATADPAAGQIAESDETNNSMSASVVVLYGRIVIDTYQPADAMNVNTKTFVSLFGPNGDTTADASIWNNNLSPYTVDQAVAIAENAGGNKTYTYFGRIDYTAGLAPGTYYVRVRGKLSTDAGGYAIRVVTSLSAPPNEYPAAEDWYYTTLNADDTPYEIDDLPQSGGVPSTPVSISVGGKLNRYLAAGDVDWFILVLP